MAGKLIYIPNYDTINYPFCRQQFVVETFGNLTYKPTNQNSIKVPTVGMPTNKQTVIIKLWVLVGDSPKSPPSLEYWNYNYTDIHEVWLQMLLLPNLC